MIRNINESYLVSSLTQFTLSTVRLESLLTIADTDSHTIDSETSGLSLEMNSSIFIVLMTDFS